MKHLFLSKELSLLARQKGFDEPCFGFHSKGGFFTCSPMTYKELKKSMVNGGLISAAPLYQQIIAWLKVKDVLVCERWDGWEYGFLAWDDFIYFKDIETAIKESFKLI